MNDKPEYAEAETELSGTSDSTGESQETENSGQTEEAQDTDASADADDGTSKEEWLVEGRFRTVEDLAKSYQNLEAEFSRRNNELHQLKRQISSPKESNPEREIERFAEDVKRNPVEAIKNIARDATKDSRLETQKIRFENEYHRNMQNKEFAELEPVMSQIAQEYGDVIQDSGLENNPRLLGILFDAARGRQAAALAKDAEIRGKKKGEATALKKTKAQVEGSSGTKGHVKRKFDELSLEEMAKELARGNLG